MEALSATVGAIAITAFTATCHRYHQHTDLKELEKLTVELNLFRKRLETLFLVVGPHHGESQAFASDFTTTTETPTGLNGPFRIFQSEISALQARIEAGRSGVKHHSSFNLWPLSANETRRFAERIEICNQIFELVVDQTQKYALLCNGHHQACCLFS